MARYEFKNGTSAKFWEVVLEGKSYTTTYGRLGTKGKSVTKSFNSEILAKQAVDKLIESKLAKGYTKVISATPKTTQSKNGTVEKALQDVVAYIKNNVVTDPDLGVEEHSQEWTILNLENRESEEAQWCNIDVRENTLIVTYGREGATGQTLRESFAARDDAEEAGLLLITSLLDSSYKVVEATKPKPSKVKKVCSRIIREFGQRELERIGSLVERITEGKIGQAADNLLTFYSQTNLSINNFYELIAVSSGAELADMGERGGFLINVVTSESPDENNLDSLVIEAISYVDIYTFWPTMFRGVADLLLLNNCTRKRYSDFAPKEKDYYFDIMEASFRHFVRPRLVEAIRRSR